MNSRGNAFVYILIAVVLFGALTFALTSADQGNDISELSEGQAEIAANEILSYSLAAKNTIVNLDRMGVPANSLIFTAPSNPAFNTPPLTKQNVFHPDGGGLNYKPLPQVAIDPSLVTNLVKPGYYLGRFNDFEWSPTADNDVLFTAYGITKSVCAAINKKITGSDAIDTSQSPFQFNEMLLSQDIHGGMGITPLDETNCPACKEQPALCIGTSNKYAFYSVLIAQ